MPAGGLTLSFWYGSDWGENEFMELELELSKLSLLVEHHQAQIFFKGDVSRLFHCFLPVDWIIVAIGFVHLQEEPQHHRSAVSLAPYSRRMSGHRQRSP